MLRRIALTTLALIPLAAHAQTRTTRPAPARPTPASPAGPARPEPDASARKSAPESPAGVSISASDMALVVEGLGLPPEARAQLASSAVERKSFANDIRQMLAAAEEAKSAGYLERPDLKLQTDLARAFVVAQAYQRQRQAAGATSFDQIVTPAEIEAFFNEPATPAQFETFVQDYAKNGPGGGSPVTDDQRKELRRNYGQVMIAMRKGVAAGLGADRKTQLLVMLQQARLLAGAYSKELEPRVKATDPEVDAYIAKHPELSAGRAKAESLLARVRAGEDFTKLARENSDDPGSRAQGGGLGWFGRGVMVKAFEDVAFALKPGEISGVVESPFGYHVIKVEERRGQPGGADEQVHARHILVMFAGAPGQPGSRPMSPREQARAAVESEKRERQLNELAARHRVTVAEDFTVGGL